MQEKSFYIRNAFILKGFRRFLKKSLKIFKIFFKKHLTNEKYVL